MSTFNLTVGRKAGVFALLVGILLSTFTQEARADAALWEAVRTGEAFAIMRHALAPGGGDPAGFRLNDCSTQRNLSEDGRQQARDIGDAFRANGIASARVMTSQWCRCRETARELGLGPVVDLPAMNSFFEHRHRAEAQTAKLRAWLIDEGATTMARGPLVLVTHQVNVSALTGLFTSSGGIVVARIDAGGKVTVLGRL